MLDVIIEAVASEMVYFELILGSGRLFGSNLPSWHLSRITACRHS